MNMTPGSWWFWLRAEKQVKPSGIVTTAGLPSVRVLT